MYELNDERAAIAAIQSLLRQVGYDIKPDGIYGDETRNAVLDFQREYRLMPTGRVDFETFELLVFLSRQDEGYIAAKIIPKTLSGGVISPGEISNIVTIIQAMLKELEVMYNFEPIEINGIFDEKTENAVREIQIINGLPINGIIDPYTWNALVGEYEKYREYI